MISWQAYQLVKVHELDKQGKKKIVRHDEVPVCIVDADSKTEAQLIAAAMYETNTFVCSVMSDKYHSAIKVAPERP